MATSGELTVTQRQPSTGGAKMRLQFAGAAWMVCVGSIVCTMTACDTTPTSSARRGVAVSLERVVTPPAQDEVMGALSPIARHIVIGLRDSAVRAELYAALHSQGESPLGVDLQTCNAGSAVGHLFTSGERHGGDPAAAICATVLARHGGILYMNSRDLAAWNPTTIPVVTAVEDPNAVHAIPRVGYRSPDRMQDLTDPKFRGPLLVVLPYVHRSRFATLRPPSMTTRTIVGPDVIPQPGARGPGPGAPTNVVFQH